MLSLPTKRLISEPTPAHSGALLGKATQKSLWLLSQAEAVVRLCCCKSETDPNENKRESHDNTSEPQNAIAQAIQDIC